MNSLMNLAWSWTEYIEKYISLSADQTKVLMNTFNIISIVLWVVLGIVGAVGAVYAIYIGVQLARADEQGKRDDAKKHLITVCIAVGATLALILIFNTFLPMIISAFSKEIGTAPGVETPDENTGFLMPLLSLFKA